jgi:hypothetical protein
MKTGAKELNGIIIIGRAVAVRLDRRRRRSKGRTKAGGCEAERSWTMRTYDCERSEAFIAIQIQKLAGEESEDLVIRPKLVRGFFSSSTKLYIDFFRPECISENCVLKLPLPSFLVVPFI